MRPSISFTLTPEQFAETVIQRMGKTRPPRPWGALRTAATVTFWAALGFLLSASVGQKTIPSGFVLYGSLIAVAASVALFFISRAGLRSLLRQGTYATTPRTLSVEEEGIRQRADSVEVLDKWPAIGGVEEQGAFVYVLLDEIHFYAIPICAFETPAEKEEFVDLVRSRASRPAQRAALDATSATRDPMDSTPASRQPGLVRTLLDAFRLALFRPVPEARMNPAWGRILGVAFATLALPVLPALWTIGVNGQWSWYSLPSAAFHLPLLLVASIATAYALGRRGDVARILYAGLLASLAIDIVTALVAWAIPGTPGFERLAFTFSWLPAAWLALALATYACRLIEPGERRLAVVAGCALFVALPLANVYRDRGLWHAPYDPDDETRQARLGIGAEDAFYKQATILSRDLQALRPGKAGTVDVFFIGMAGYGRQDVFMREVRSVSRLLQDRFGAEGHTIQLINNPKSLSESPIASKTSLRAALNRVAEVMNKDEDVLVLFMTSHGTETHRFSLELWPMRFHEIDPATLRALLDESGIRNRVVIVSACYSGGFVEPLRDPGTLVITASAADRNSFGCSNTADWTYFGKAYFDEALRNTRSFAKAFTIAAPAIAEREKAEKYEPSNPQISMGSAIAPKLELLESQLEGRGSTAESR